MKFTKLISLALVMAMALAMFAGCSSNEETTAATQATTAASGETATTAAPAGDAKIGRTDIVLGYTSDVVSPDPHATNDSQSSRANRLIYNSLLENDFEGQPQPSLAESWEVVDDTTYLFHLRKDVKFHNGYDFTAEDVKYSIEEQQESPSVQHLVKQIESVEVIDDYTVQIKIKQPYAPTLSNLGMQQSSIKSKKWNDELMAEGKKYADYPVGTGPMIFDSWAPNNSFKVVRNDNYWGEKAVATSITLRVIPEATSMTIALETGEIDMIDSVTAVDIPRVKENADLKTMELVSSSITYLSYNMKKQPYDNLKVRQAMSHAVDKEAMVSVICEGYAQVMNNVYPVTMKGYLEDINYYPYDVEKAKALMAEAGYPDGFKAEIATSGDERNRISQLLQADFGQIGIELDIELLEWGAYLEYTSNSDHEMFILGWSFGTEPEANHTPLFHTESGGATGNRAWYSNPKVDELLEKGASTINWEDREPLYQEMQHIVSQDAVWVPLFSKTTVVAMNKNLEGLQITPAKTVYTGLYIAE